MTGFAQNEELRNGAFQAPAVNGTSNWGIPEKGDIVYDSSNNTFNGYNGTTWDNFSANASAAGPSTPGYVTATGTQTFGGNKVFNGSINPVGGIVGNNSGSAASSGNVGQLINSSVTNATVSASGSGYANTVYKTLTLDKGIYLITARLTISGFGGTTGLVIATLNSGTGSPTLIGGTTGSAYGPGGDIIRIPLNAYVLVTSDSSTVTLSSSTATGSTITGTVSFGGDLAAVRIN